MQATYVASRSHALLNLRAEPRTFSIHARAELYTASHIPRRRGSARLYRGAVLLRSWTKIHFPGLRDTLSISGTIQGWVGSYASAPARVAGWRSRNSALSLASWTTNQLTSGVSALQDTLRGCWLYWKRAVNSLGVYPVLPCRLYVIMLFLSMHGLLKFLVSKIACNDIQMLHRLPWGLRRCWSG